MNGSNRNGSHRNGHDSDRPLVDRLRTTLQAARGNVQIRERLKTLIVDPEEFDPIVRELGPRHALVRELLAIARHADSAADHTA